MTTTYEREGNPLHPFDPVCGRYASEMDDYDTFIFESPEDEAENGPVTPEMREAYVREEEGTYNRLNGHFLCDKCYLAKGMPSGPAGWTCP
jgi:hypothetical protein